MSLEESQIYTVDCLYPCLQEDHGSVSKIVLMNTHEGATNAVT